MWDSFWDFLWMAVLVFAFIAYLLILFNILVDLFLRDHRTSGWAKAVWVVFLIVLPYLTALVYVVVRGTGMAERAQATAAARQAAEQNRKGAGHSPAREIAEAKRLLDDGVITQAEFESLKTRALS